MRRVRVLALPRYDAMGASSRIRMLQYVPLLERRNVQVTVLPLLSNAYLARLYRGMSPDVADTAASYLRRMWSLLRRDRYQTVWVEKECFPWLPYGIERFFLHRTRLVVDYDDAQWLRYSHHESVLVRRLLDGKIQSFMQSADRVIAGNRWLREFAEQQGARDVVMVPSVVDLDRYPMAKKQGVGQPCVIGWIGSPATAQYVRQMGGCLAELVRRRRIRLVCVGVDRLELPGVEVETRPWHEATEANEIRSFDIGMMPLRDGLWERGKCGYKLIQCMACGIPVIASAVGANCDIIENGVTGFLARDDRDWLQAFERLMDDASLYASMSTAARRMVEKFYSVQSRLDEMEAALRP